MGKYRTRSAVNPHKARFDYTGLCGQSKKKFYLSERGEKNASRYVQQKIQLQKEQRRQDRQPRNQRNQRSRRKRWAHKKRSKQTTSSTDNRIDAINENEDDIKNDIDQSNLSVDDQDVFEIVDIENVIDDTKGNGKDDLSAAMDLIDGQIIDLKKSKELTPKHLKMYEKCNVLKMYLMQRIDGISKMVIYDNVRKIYGYCRQTAREWVKQLFGGDSGQLTPVTLSKTGNHTKIAKGLQSIEDHYEFKKYVHGLIRERKAWGTRTVTYWVNTVLLKDQVTERGRPYSERTVRQWLVDAGFVWHRFSKSEYPDGHEREDVIQVS